MSILNQAFTHIQRQNVLMAHWRDTFRIARNPALFIARKRVAKRLKNTTNIQIQPSEGYARGSLGDLPQIDAMHPLLKSIADERYNSIDREMFNNGVAERTVKPFYFNLIGERDLLTHSAFLDFSLSQEMISIVSEYTGILPELSHMAIFYSGEVPPNDKNRGTQVFHWDAHDFQHIKFFYFLDDVTEKDGPLMLLPADKSEWLRHKTGRRFRTLPFRDDAELFRYFSKSDLVPLVGKEGSFAFVDTSRCLHCGSRTSKEGRRRTFVVHYTKFADYNQARSLPFQDFNMAVARKCHSVAQKTPTSSLAYRLLN